MLNLEFFKVNDFTYSLSNPNELIALIESYLNKLSLDTTDSYDTNVNMELFNSMMSRYISAVFLKKHSEAFTNIAYVNINVNVKGSLQTYTVGYLSIKDKTVNVNGVLYT